MAKFTVAEGVGNIIMDNNHPLHGAAYDLGEWNEKHQDQFAGAIEAYHALWDSLNAKRGYTKGGKRKCEMREYPERCLN